MQRDMDCHEALYFLNSLNAEPNNSITGGESVP